MQDDELCMSDRAEKSISYESDNNNLKVIYWI